MWLDVKPNKFSIVVPLDFEVLWFEILQGAKEGGHLICKCEVYPHMDLGQH
jgi:hypothetical protein